MLHANSDSLWVVGLCAKFSFFMHVSFVQMIYNKPVFLL